MNAKAGLRNFFLMLCLIWAPHSNAITIQYQALDLADTTPGQDLWQYNYQLSDATFAAGQGFSIFFDPTLYDALQNNPPVVNADWDVITLQPDPLLPDAGLYDALALNDGASLADRFTVDFTWLGAGTPGAQNYVMYDNMFSTIESGTSIPTVAVPEPATALLMGVGLIGFVSLERWRQRRGQLRA
jgi:hypothetical protein